MNPLGAIAAVISIIGFSFCYPRLCCQSLRLRLAMLVVFGLLSVPAILFAVHYLHVLPERTLFYTFRSWSGTEFCSVFFGIASASAASLLPRKLLMVPLFGLVGVVSVPYLKPILVPLADDEFQAIWRDDVCRQSTASTCGPASVATILRQLGMRKEEKEIAREAFSYAGGTEAWYLARYIRGLGFEARFEFTRTFSPEVGQPAVVGVKIGNAGHFIAVLGISDTHVTFADPMSELSHLPLEQFRQRYVFTGFHMVITKRD